MLMHYRSSFMHRAYTGVQLPVIEYFGSKRSYNSSKDSRGEVIVLCHKKIGKTPTGCLKKHSACFFICNWHINSQIAFYTNV